MTDQQPPTPSIELLSQWCEDWNPNDAFLAEHVAMQAARWGWQQRDASVADELQRARDEELDACISWIRERPCTWTAEQLRAARRPKPKSLAEEALDAIDEERADVAISSYKVIRRALERLKELEGQA